MIVVVLGGLAALGIVGVSSLNDSKSAIATITSTTLARTDARTATTRAGAPGGVGRGVGCVTSADAARAAAAEFYATSGGAFPTRWADMTAAQPPSLQLPSGVTVNATNPDELDGYGWKLLLAGGGASEPTFTCQTVAP
jgi:hypothetical protein